MAESDGNRASGGAGPASSGGGVLPTLVAAAAMAIALVRILRERRPATVSADGSATGGTTTTAGPDDDQGGSLAAPAAEPEGFVGRTKVTIDRYQRSRAWLAFPLAVGKKFGEDKAGYLAALVAYFGFFSVFPLMLAFTSILGFVVSDPEDQQEFSDAAADQIPVVGDTIRNTAGTLEGSVVAIVVGSLVALWAGLRIVDAMQNALNDVWDLPRTSRPKLARRRLRGVGMLVLIGGGLVGSIAASNVAAFVDVIPGAGKLAIWGASALVSVLLYLFAFQLLTDAELPWRDLWPGAIFGGVSWWALQTFGSAYIVRQQEAAGETYGEFAAIIALMAFLFLAAQLSILGAEISVVKARRLWPRSLVQGEFTPADLDAFEHLATSTLQNEHYRIRVQPLPSSRVDDRGGGRGV